MSFVPHPDSCTATNNVHGCNDLLDHLVGAGEERGRHGDPRARRGDRGSGLARAWKESQAVIVGDVSLEAAPTARQDDAEATDHRKRTQRAQRARSSRRPCGTGKQRPLP
jgi:hypothetical protein